VLSVPGGGGIGAGGGTAVVCVVVVSLDSCANAALPAPRASIVTHAYMIVRICFLQNCLGYG
jgi:hypothetical protein